MDMATAYEKIAAANVKKGSLEDAVVILAPTLSLLSQISESNTLVLTCAAPATNIKQSGYGGTRDDILSEFNDHMHHVQVANWKNFILVRPTGNAPVWSAKSV